MVVGPGDITRTDVQNMIDEWNDTKGDKPSLEDFIRAKVEEMLGENDPQVYRAEGEDLQFVHVADKIIDDLDSYDLAPSS
jgi:hypothetical protein